MPHPLKTTHSHSCTWMQCTITRWLSWSRSCLWAREDGSWQSWTLSHVPFILWLEQTWGLPQHFTQQPSSVCWTSRHVTVLPTVLALPPTLCTGVGLEGVIKLSFFFLKSRNIMQLSGDQLCCSGMDCCVMDNQAPHSWPLVGPHAATWLLTTTQGGRRPGWLWCTESQISVPRFKPQSQIRI